MSAPSSSSSATVTTTVVQVATEQQPPPSHLRLKLRARKRVVRWADDVEDNEDLCRKKSKCCCVYHKPFKFGDDWSDDEEGPGHGGDWLGRNAGDGTGGGGGGSGDSGASSGASNSAGTTAGEG
jgi:protein phosphatase 1 regulatory subunit 11